MWLTAPTFTSREAGAGALEGAGLFGTATQLALVRVVGLTGQPSPSKSELLLLDMLDALGRCAHLRAFAPERGIPPMGIITQP